MSKNSEIFLSTGQGRQMFNVTCTLKIPNFFILPEYDGPSFDIRSPPFKFALGTWCFRFKREEKEKDENETEDDVKEFEVSLIRLKCTRSDESVFYEIALLDADDRNYECEVDTLNFRGNKEESYMCLFHNDKCSYDKRDCLTVIAHLFQFRSSELDADQSVTTDNDQEIAKKSNDCEIFLSPGKLISSITCTMKIPKISILPASDDTSVSLYSPSFQFANAAWCFKLKSRHSNSVNKVRKFKGFDLYMIRLNFVMHWQRIFYETILLDADAKEYRTLSDCSNFEENNNEVSSGYFDKKIFSDEHKTEKILIHLFQIESTEMITTMDRGLSQNLKDVLINGQDHNLTFTVKDKKFRAHQDILRARSEVFRSMLSHDMLEKNRGIIDVPDCDPEIFEQLLFYIYTGQVEILDENNMFGLYYTADKYNVAHLKEVCGEFMKKSLTINNICDALEIAIKHSDSSLLACASNYFYTNFEEILHTTEWQSFLKENSTVANELIIKSVKKLRDSMS